MNRKRFVVALAALVLSLAGAGTLWWYAQSADQRAVAGLTAVDVYVAKGDIPAGTPLSTALGMNLLDIQRIPQRLAPVGATTTVDPSMTGNVAASDIHAGELVLLSQFVAPQTTDSGLAIPTGLIAVSVDVADTPRVGNFVHPGSHVAMFLISPTPGGTGKQTRLLLADVLVLAVGDSTNGATGSAQTPSTRLTVAVSQHDGERLIQSTTAGTLYLGLMTDRSTVAPGPAVTDSNLFG